MEWLVLMEREVAPLGCLELGRRPADAPLRIPGALVVRALGARPAVELAETASLFPGGDSVLGVRGSKELGDRLEPAALS